MVTPPFGGETGNMGSRMVAVRIFYGWTYETSRVRRFFVPEGEGLQIAYLLLPERRMGVGALTPFQGVLVEGVLRMMEVMGGMRNR